MCDTPTLIADQLIDSFDLLVKVQRNDSATAHRLSYRKSWCHHTHASDHCEGCSELIGNLNFQIMLSSLTFKSGTIFFFSLSFSVCFLKATGLVAVSLKLTQYFDQIPAKLMASASRSAVFA